MLTRKRYREVPPRVDYELTERARELMPILGELARWGYEWAWTPPRTSESVDVGAIFRLAPGLLRGSGISGTVACTVTGEPDRTYTVTLTPGETLIEERPAEMSDASISGGVAAWVEAFSPQPERARLELAGDLSLANRLLDGLTGVQPARAAAASSNPGTIAAA